MKKLYLFALTFFLFMIVPSVNALASSGKAELDVGQITAGAGESVKVPVSISDNTGICGAALTISYDENLKLSEMDSGEAFSTLNMTKPGDFEANPVRILWDGVNEDTSNGVIAVLIFTAPEEPGTYPVAVTYESGDIIDGNITPIDMEITNGYVTVKDIKADKNAVKSFNDIITSMNPDDKGSVETARAAYESLTKEQKELVDAELLQQLTDAEESIARIEEKQKTDQEAADHVSDFLSKLDIKDKDSVTTAREKYDALSEEQKALVDKDVLRKLTDAEETISKAEKKQKEDQKAADEITVILNQIDTNHKNTVTNAREKYDALSEEQKVLVDKNALRKLTDAEETISKAEKKQKEDQKAADEITAILNQIDTKNKNDVSIAKEKYDALPEEQKALVDKAALKRLTDAEKVIIQAEIQQKKDEEVVKNLEAIVSGIPKLDNVILLDESKIKDARTALNSLDENQKALVPKDTIRTIEAAEAKIKELKEGSKHNTIPIKVSSIKLSGISKKIAAGKKIKLSPSVLPENASNKKLRWTTSNKKVATVTQNGVVSIKKKTGGKSVTISAAATDGSNKKAVWKIKVMKGVVKKIAVKGQKRTLKVNKTMKLNATVKATAGANKKLKWTSSNNKWATVNSKGVVRALKAGKGKTVKITVMATDGSNIKKIVKFKIN